jgi:hypothetical protein
MFAKKVLLISILAIISLAFGKLPSAALTLESDGNPHPRKDNFSNWPSFGADEDWQALIIDGTGGNISVNGPTTFDNSSAEITTGKELHFFQVYDSDFEAEAPYQYNNVCMLGFPGYLPTTERDVIWNYEMKIEPGLYGSTGFVVEHQGTFASDGTFALPFTFFGISYAGEGNFNPGLSCTNVVDWVPVWQAPVTGVDPFVWNSYEINFHWIDNATVQATISVNDTQVCQTTLDNYGATEVQIWLDNYQVSLDPSNPQGYSIGFSNGEDPQGVLYDNIAVKAKPAP